MPGSAAESHALAAAGRLSRTATTLLNKHATGNVVKMFMRKKGMLAWFAKAGKSLPLVGSKRLWRCNMRETHTAAPPLAMLQPDSP